MKNKHQRNSRTVHFSCILSVWLLTLSYPFNIQSQNIAVSIQGMESVGGKIIACLTDKTGFLKSCIREQMVSISAGKAIDLNFDNVPSGQYAITVFYDLNSNHQLDTRSLFKIPEEPFGFSRNPKLILGPPSFSQCMFDHVNEDLKLCIKLKSL